MSKTKRVLHSKEFCAPIWPIGLLAASRQGVCLTARPVDRAQSRLPGPCSNLGSGVGLFGFKLYGARGPDEESYSASYSGSLCIIVLVRGPARNLRQGPLVRVLRPVEHGPFLP